MNRKISSKFLMLALAVGMFGVVSAKTVFGQNDTAATSTSIDNVAPAITVAPSDGSSSSTTPTDAGDDVTFTVTATDVNNDDYYLAVCKTDAVTAGSSAAPTCDGGAWAISTATTEGNEATVTYTTSSGDAESNVWYAFVCDGNGNPGLCSATGAQGSGDSGSPFAVNHAGTYGEPTETDTTGGSIEPGEIIRFTISSANLADSDTDGTQDLLNMYICSNTADRGGLTTGFDYSTNTCTGGTLICSDTNVDPTSEDATCDEAAANLAAIPTAHGSYSYKVFVEDMHSFPATGTDTRTYAVTDVAPVLTQYATEAISLSPDSSDTVTLNVQLSDDNGDNDPTNVDLVLFDSNAVTNTCTSDENDCYIINSGTIDPASPPANCTTSGTRSSAGSDHTASGSDKDLTVQCDFTVWFNANYSTAWNVNATVTDGTGATVFADSANFASNAVSAIGVNETSISYGTVAIDSDSAAQQTTLMNYGNQVIDVQVSGTDMSDGGSHTIAAAQQKWDHSATTFDWSTGGYALLNTPSGTTASGGCVNRDLAVRNTNNTGSTATEDEVISWIIHIPAAQESGTYTGTNTFSAATSTLCDGTQQD